MPRKPKAADGQKAVARKRPSPNASAPPHERSGGHRPVGNHCPSASPDLSPIIAEIRAWHRQRVFAMDQRKRSDLALGSFIRTQLGWSRALPKAEADKISKSARDLIALGEKVAKEKDTGDDVPEFCQWGAVILASIHGRSHWDAIEWAATKQMERLAASLPVWPAFGEPIKGFGARSLAVIVGEAGDLSNYANPGKLWKRMGLAVMDGVRQGGLRKTASKEEWIAHGYNAKRRSMMFVIGDVLIKNKNEYREVYLARKTEERKKAAAKGLTIAPAAKIPEKRKHEFMSDGHVHRRAQRYMEKRLLKNLWRAWRRAELPLITKGSVPADEIQQQAIIALLPARRVSAAEGAAIEAVTPVVGLPHPYSSPQGERSASSLMLPNERLPSESIPVKAGGRVTLSLKPIPRLPAQSQSPQGERSAKIALKSKQKVPSAPLPVKAGKRKADSTVSPVRRLPSAP